MREVKKHWNDGTRERTRDGIYVKQRSLCGREFIFGGFANKKSAVTCRNCARILAGYKGENK